jgi:hypothetical protein
MMLSVYLGVKTMRKIEYGFNSYLKTACISIDFAPFWVFALDRLIENVCGYLVPPIPFPHIKITRDGEKTTMREYYGDLRQLFHCHIHSPIFRFCCKKMDTRNINVDYELIRKAFYDKDKDFWDEGEQRAEEMRHENKSR